jgi:hypothetical protein
VPELIIASALVKIYNRIGLSMDFNLPPASDSPQVALYAMQSQQAGRSAAGAPPDASRLAVLRSPRVRQRLTTDSLTDATDRPANSLASNQTRCPTTYYDLPPEILQQVAEHMPLCDMGHFSSTDRRTYHALQERRLSWLCCKRVHLARDLTSIQQLLGEIERIRAEPVLRAEPLSMLWPWILDLPKEQQPTAFQQVYEAAGRVPERGAQIQKYMFESLCDFSPEQQCALYDFAYAAAQRWGVEQGSLWPAVASLLKSLRGDPPRFLRAYRDFLGRLPVLDVDDQADVIVELARLLPSMRRYGNDVNGTHVEYWEILLQWVERLPASHRSEPITALANEIWLVPGEQRPGYYANLWRWTLSLPDHQLGRVLRYLPHALALLPPAHHAYELSQLEPLLQRMLPAQRTQVALGLLSMVPFNTALSTQIWQRALRLLDGAYEVEVLHVLDEAGARVAPHLSEQQWEEAKAEILVFIERNRLSEWARIQLLDLISI